MLSKLYNRKALEGGFTLIELLVVVIIISILAAIALPIFINQSRIATDASVKSDVRNSVTNITNAQAQQEGAAKAAVSQDGTELVLTVAGASGAASTSSTAKKSDSSPQFTNVPALASGYVVCGFNDGGAKLTSANPWGFASATGQFAGSNCGSDGAPAIDPSTGIRLPSGGTSGGVNPAPSTSPTPSPSTTAPTTDPYASDPTQVEVDPVMTTLTSNGYSTYNGFAMHVTTADAFNQRRVPTGKDGAMIRSKNLPMIDTYSASYNGTPYLQQLTKGYLGSSLNVTMHKADGTVINNWYQNVCSITFQLTGKNYPSGNPPAHDVYALDFTCSNGGFFVPNATNPNAPDESLSGPLVRDLLAGGYFTFVAAGDTQRVDISPNLQLEP